MCLYIGLLLQGWNMYAQLLIDLFKFLAPFLRNAELTKPTQLLYKVGSLRRPVQLISSFTEQRILVMMRFASSLWRFSTEPHVRLESFVVPQGKVGR